MPGQGAQYPGMGSGLYQAVPAFSAILDKVFDVMGQAGDDLRSDWLAADPVLPIDHVCRSQPLLFAIDYSLGKLFMTMGQRPAVLLGHSIGELAAATLAGVVALEDAVRVLQHRVGQLARAPKGGMVAVAASREEIGPYLGCGVDIAAINAPRQTVISGTDEGLRTTSDVLRGKGFTLAPVFSLIPFHSAVLQPVVNDAGPLLSSLPLRPPQITMISGYTGRNLTGTEATDPMYWARHPVDPVLFWPALQALLANGPCLLVECGPGQGLITLARRHRDVRTGRSEVMSLIGSQGDGPDGEAGHFAAAAERLRLSLP